MRITRHSEFVGAQTARAVKLKLTRVNWTERTATDRLRNGECIMLPSYGRSAENNRNTGLNGACAQGPTTLTGWLSDCDYALKWSVLDGLYTCYSQQHCRTSTSVIFSLTVLVLIHFLFLRFWSFSFDFSSSKQSILFHSSRKAKHLKTVTLLGLSRGQQTGNTEIFDDPFFWCASS